MKPSPPITRPYISPSYRRTLIAHRFSNQYTPKSFKNQKILHNYPQNDPKVIFTSQKRTIFSWFRFHLQHNSNRFYTHKYSKHRYPGQQYRPGHERSVLSNPFQKAWEDLITNTLTVLLAITVLCIGLEFNNLHDKRHHTWLSTLKGAITGVVFRDDIAPLRVNPLLSWDDDQNTNSPNGLTSRKNQFKVWAHLGDSFDGIDEEWFQTANARNNKTRAQLDNLSDQYVTSTSTSCEFQIPIEISPSGGLHRNQLDADELIEETSPQIPTQSHCNPCSSHSSYPYDPDLNEIHSQLLYIANLVSFQNRSFSASTLYDSYQLLKDINTNSFLYNSFTLSQKVVCLMVWWKLTRLRDFLGRELLRVNDDLVDVAKLNKIIRLVHQNGINTSNSSTDPSNPKIDPNTSPFGGPFHTFLMERMIRTHSLAVMTERYYNCVYNWGLYMHSINDGRFLIKYADLSPPPQKLTDFYSKLNNIHQNGANMEEGGRENGQGLFSRLSSAISSSNSEDFGPTSSTAIEFPPSNPLPWHTLNDFEEEYQSLYSQLLTCEEANYSSIASLARQSTEPFSSDSQSHQLWNQLEGACGVKTSGGHWAAAHQIILPHTLKPSDRIAMQRTCPEDAGLYLYRYRPKVLYHDKLRIKIPVFNDFINIQQVQSGLYSSQMNYLKPYLLPNQDDYQIGGIMKVRDGKSLREGIEVEIGHPIDDDAIDSGVGLLADSVGSLGNGDSCDCLANELPVGLKKVMKENGIQWLGGPATAQTLLRQHGILPTFRFTATQTNGRKC
jgi:hypothetical protein